MAIPIMGNMKEKAMRMAISLEPNGQDLKGLVQLLGLIVGENGCQVGNMQKIITITLPEINISFVKEKQRSIWQSMNMNFGM